MYLERVNERGHVFVELVDACLIQLV